MYTKYLQVLAKSASQVFQEMTNTEVISASIKRDERLMTGFSVAQVIEYEHLDNRVRGYFMLGFTSKAIAVMVASAIAEGMGLPHVEQLDGQTIDILNEFMNTIIGRAISKWDQQGFPVRFRPPVSLEELEVESYRKYPVDPYMIILSLAVSHIVLRVTFARPPGSETEPCRILVVDDSMLIRKLLNKALTEAGYAVEEAADGQLAVDKYKSFKPDLTIMDLIMPKMGGLDAVVEIREANPKAKVIILSSTARKDEIVTAKTLGILNYIVKPVRFPDFLDLVKKIIEEPGKDDPK